MTSIEQTAPPLRGIIHAAGSIDDGIIMHQTWARFCAVWAAKVQGSYHLHTLTRDQSLDFFVLFSSTVALLGSPGQANYAAANAFMDALAYQRHAAGLPATIIQWGPWAEVGMAAQRPTQSPNQHQPSLSISHALQSLTYALGYQWKQLCVLPHDWQRWLEWLPAPARSSLIAHYAPINDKASSHAISDSTTGHPEQILTGRNSRFTASQRVEDYLTQQVSHMLGQPIQSIDHHQSLLHIGFDSLMAIELRNRIETDLDIQLPMSLLLQHPQISELATLIEEQRPSRGAPDISADTTMVFSSHEVNGYLPDQPAQLLALVDHMSDTIVELLLHTMLAEKEVL